MDRFRPALAFSLFLAALLIAGPVRAAKVYTTDTQEVPLRLTPNSAGKSILMIPPASALELMNSRTWVRVRYTKPGGEARDGWVQLGYLSARPPDSAIARELGSENDSLKERLDALDQEKTGLSQREKELTEKLTKLNAAYEELKGGSGNYLKLKGEYDSAKTSLAGAQENIQSLLQENENLKLSQRLRGFLAGAGVLFCGLFLGWWTGRRQKKKKGSYYY